MTTKSSNVFVCFFLQPGQPAMAQSKQSPYQAQSTEVADAAVSKVVKGISKDAICATTASQANFCNPTVLHILALCGTADR